MYLASCPVCCTCSSKILVGYLCALLCCLIPYLPVLDHFFILPDSLRAPPVLVDILHPVCSFQGLRVDFGISSPPRLLFGQGGANIVLWLSWYYRRLLHQSSRFRTVVSASDNLHIFTGGSAPQWWKFSRSMFSLSVFTYLRLDCKVLISGCPNVIRSACSVFITWFMFSSILFVCDWFFSC